jgi:hypothetical protein
LLHVYFYFIFLFFSLLDIMSCMCECHSLFPLFLFVFLRLSCLDYNKMVSCRYNCDGMLFRRKYEKRSGYSTYQRWWVCTWQLFVSDGFLSSLSAYRESIGCPYITFTSVNFNLVEMKKKRKVISCQSRHFWFLFQSYRLFFFKMHEELRQTGRHLRVLFRSSHA